MLYGTEEACAKDTPFGAINSIRVASHLGDEFLQEEDAVAAYGSFLRSSLAGELTASGFVEFLSVERATHALTKVGGSVTPYGPINLEYALSRKDIRMCYNEPAAHCTAHVMALSSWSGDEKENRQTERANVLRLPYCASPRASPSPRVFFAYVEYKGRRGASERAARRDGTPDEAVRSGEAGVVSGACAGREAQRWKVCGRGRGRWWWCGVGAIPASSVWSRVREGKQGRAPGRRKGRGTRGGGGDAAKVYFPPSAYLTSGEVAVVIGDIGGPERCDGIGGGGSHRLGTVALCTVHELMGARTENRDGNPPYFCTLLVRASERIDVQAASAIVGSSEVEDVVVAEKPPRERLAHSRPRGAASLLQYEICHFRRAGHPFARLEATLSYPIVPKPQAQQQRDGRKKGAFGNVGIKIALCSSSTTSRTRSRNPLNKQEDLGCRKLLLYRPRVLRIPSPRITSSLLAAVSRPPMPESHTASRTPHLLRTLPSQDPYKSSRRLTSLFGYPKKLAPVAPPSLQFQSTSGMERRSAVPSPAVLLVTFSPLSLAPAARLPIPPCILSTELGGVGAEKAGSGGGPGSRKIPAARKRASAAGHRVGLKVGGQARSRWPAEGTSLVPDHIAPCISIVFVFRRHSSLDETPNATYSSHHMFSTY
ncbi:hypothetical protein K438DRAFT_1939350 [Mycena galopus ATCC 62051]|nr:hypothetical protein K438DRAFT_1939350 [Mycena galopus ATCC 62051]